VPRKRLLIWSLLLVAGVLSLAACGAGSNSSSPATTTTPSGGSTSSSAFAKYTTCMKQHGVTLPSGGAGGGPPQSGGGLQNLSSADRAKFQSARTACAGLRPAGAGPGFQQGGGNSAAFAAYSNCLKLHGVTLKRGSRPDTTSKKVQTAMAACASLRPSATTPPASN
jgi:hypothetical protein